MRLLRGADFRNLWLGETVSLFGDQVTLIALPLAAVLVLDADAAEMGYLTAAALVPHLLFSLPAGAWLERVERRRWLMIASDVARGGLLASIPIAYALDALTFGQLYAVAFLTGTFAVIFARRFHGRPRPALPRSISMPQFRSAVPRLWRLLSAPERSQQLKTESQPPGDLGRTPGRPQLRR